jgi:RNA-binding protein Musashi
VKPFNAKKAMELRMQEAFVPKVFVGGVPSNVTETELEVFFSKFGMVNRAVVGFKEKETRSRGVKFFLGLFIYFLVNILYGW